ncbi:MAG: hypothetical protein HQ536_05120 [Parcubacteria group bacterium]|nr:hypothetical protein [Parcubacteria group bacterium]
MGNQLVRGYVIKDETGILALVPLSYKNSHQAVDYVRNHQVIETLTKRDDEDMLNFKFRLQERVAYWNTREIN